MKPFGKNVPFRNEKYFYIFLILTSLNYFPMINGTLFPKRFDVQLNHYRRFIFISYTNTIKNIVYVFIINTVEPLDITNFMETRKIFDKGRFRYTEGLAKLFSIY